MDDTDTIQTGEKNNSTATVLNKAQAELNLWEELIRATGGGLEGEKSDFAIVNYTWKQGKWSYEKPKEGTALHALLDNKSDDLNGATRELSKLLENVKLHPDGVRVRVRRCEASLRSVGVAAR